jgi:hypothetical protein
MDLSSGETLLRYGGKMLDWTEKTLSLDQQTLENSACDAPRSLVGLMKIYTLTNEVHEKEKCSSTDMHQLDTSIRV